MKKFFVINLAIPGAGAVLGHVYAPNLRTAEVMAVTMFPKHAAGCGIHVVEDTEL